MNEYNANLIKYSPQATKFLLRGAFGAAKVDVVVEGLYLMSLALYLLIFECLSAWPGSF